MKNNKIETLIFKAKKSDTEGTWRLPSPPIVEKNMWFPYVNWESVGTHNSTQEKNNNKLFSSQKCIKRNRLDKNRQKNSALKK